MADITMCTNKKCTLKNTCYRFNAIPNINWQSYSLFHENNCEYYWPMNEKDNETKTIK